MILCAILGAAMQSMKPALIPVPETVQWRTGSFVIRQDTPIVGEGDAAAIAKQFQDMIGVGVIGQAPKGSQEVVFRIDTRAGKPDVGSYVLTVNSGQVTALSRTAQGLFYAMQTLRQLLPVEVERRAKTLKNWTLPAVYIEDAPRFQWRGMHLDVSRHFFSVSNIKKYIDTIASNKMNVFHWHLIDDGGWRLEIKKYPLLTSIGAFRVASEPWSQRNLSFPGTSGEERLYGGYYSQVQVQEIVKYAAERFITVIPEIELPGHTLPSLVAYPHLACQNADLGEFYRLTGNYKPNVYCAGNDDCFKFLDDIFAEVCDLFSSPYIHIGGDEVNKYLWSKCQRCAERMETEKLKNVDELQSYFIKRVEKLLEKRGKKLVGWDEILEGGVAPSATVMSWRGEAGGIEAAKMGHDVVMSPTSPCYFDYSYKDNATRKVYEYDPVPKELQGSASKHVLGAQGNVWTEWMINIEKVEQMIFPRCLALAESVWSRRKTKDWKDFESRLGRFFERLDARGVQFTLPRPELEETLIFFDRPIMIDLSAAKYSGLALRYTTDGTNPTANSKEYSGAVTISSPCVFKAAYVSNGRMVGEVSTVHIVKNQYQDNSNLQRGLQRRVYQGNWSNVPDFASLTPQSAIVVKTIDIKDLAPRDNFGVQWVGVLRIPQDGEYTFYLGSDDGSYMNLNGVRFINNDGLHAYSIESSRVKLKRGDYAFEIGYFEQGGAENLTLEVSTSQFKRSAVPSEWLLCKGLR